MIILIPLGLFLQFSRKFLSRKSRALRRPAEPGAIGLRDFELGWRIPFVLSLAAFTLVFAVYLPLVALLFVFQVFLLFWIDKIYYYDSSRRFPLESAGISKTLLLSMPVVLLFAIAVSVFTLGDFEHFPTSRGFFVSKFDVGAPLPKALLSLYSKWSFRKKLEFQLCQFLPLTILFFAVLLYSATQTCVFRFWRKKFAPQQIPQFSEGESLGYDFRNFDDAWKRVSVK